MKKNFFGWVNKNKEVEVKEPSYKAKDIEVLLDKIKEFNAGVIDAHLTKHVDRVFEEWKDNLNK